jgi:hypothetical protein
LLPIPAFSGTDHRPVIRLHPETQMLNAVPRLSKNHDGTSRPNSDRLDYFSCRSPKRLVTRHPATAFPAHLRLSFKEALAKPGGPKEYPSPNS